MALFRIVRESYKDLLASVKNNENQTAYNKNFDASITKADFPDMKVRGRVIENRVDIDLERNGNILVQGRDEKQVIQNKREAE